MMLEKIKKKLDFLKYIDPFYYVDKYLVPKINPENTEWVNWIIYLVSALFFAWLIYFALGLLLSTSSPMVIVVSGSMEPVLYRGDVVIMQGISPENIKAEQTEIDLPTLKRVGFSEIAKSDTIPPKNLLFNNGVVIPVNETGDIVVYTSVSRRNSGQPVIHRVIAKVKAADGYYLITKGDNNNVIDQDCGKVIAGLPQYECITLYPIPANEISGRAVFKIPLIGYVKLLIFDDLPALVFGCRADSTSILCNAGK